MKNEEDNYCAKCCKTRNIIDRIFTEIPEFNQKFELSYEDVYSTDNLAKFGELTPPAIVIDDHIFSEGHVPIMKKLALDLRKINITPQKDKRF